MGNILNQKYTETFEWKSPQRQIRRSKYGRNYEELVNRLKEKPGCWALIATSESLLTIPKQLKEYAVECKTRSFVDSVDQETGKKTYELYARYVGE